MDFPSCRVASPDGLTVAEFVPDLGMVCCSLMHDGEQLVHSGKGLEAYARAGSTMGIPLLFPWANRLGGLGYRAAGKTVVLPDDRSCIPIDPNGLPIHGVLPRLMRWSPAQRADESELTASLAWDQPELLDLYPYPHQATVEVKADDGQLTIATSVYASASDAVPVAFGYHPYLQLPDSDRRGWHVQLPAMERLVLNEQMIPTGERNPLGDRELALGETSWDDGFVLHAQPARFTVSSGGRGIAIEFVEGYPYAQIYAPPGHNFICFEPMTAPANALVSGDDLVVVAPGDQYRAVFRVSAWGD